MLIIYCCERNYSRAEWLKTMINIYYFTEYLRVWTLRGFGSGSPMRLQSGYEPGLQSSEGLPVAGGSASTRLTQIAGQLALALGRRPQFLPEWTFLRG